jgi:uncharacterized protein (TIGR03083 family)
VTATEANPYPEIKAYERQAFERLTSYLEKLDADGWIEQSYCTDWLVYQVVSHLGSGCRIGKLRLAAWVGGGPPVTREVMQQTWGFFDSLKPEQMLAAYSSAAAEYLAAEAETPDDAGQQEVDGFAGRRPMHAYQLARVWELACHSWDVYVARDNHARLDAAAVGMLARALDQIFLPLDNDRAAALAARPIAFKLTGSGTSYTLDPAAERPRLQAGASSDAAVLIEGPDEEVVRFVSGRHFIPGARPELRVARGSAQDLAALRRAFR